MIIDEEEYIIHYGVLRRSGRYPWGSGQDQNTRNKSFLDHVDELRAKGFSETEIVKAFGLESTTQLRALKSMANAEQKMSNIREAQRLADKGMSNPAIARQMGLAGESSVRALLAPGAKDKAEQLMSISEMLKRQVKEKQFVDVGIGVENHIQVSKDRLNVALEMLKEQGYSVHELKTPQTTTVHDTRRKVLVAPGVTQKEAWLNRNNIQQISEVSTDRGREKSWGHIDHPPMSIDPKRVAIKYGNEGGTEKDGVIYVREGVPDVSLGKSRYAQVRVKVGDDHYLKGMAMYSDNIPAGADLLFHTNKDYTGNKLDVMKPLKDDPDIPFGSLIKRQITEHTGTPEERLTSAMNIVNEEGDWKNWSRSISAQALSKQKPSLAKQQLDRMYNSRRAEYDEIMALNNPVVRKKLLETFSDSTDKSSVHLKAAALERQNWFAILPIESLRPTEIYAPKYNQGERVALIRYPHGGTFEIPDLIVNNRNVEARRLLGNAIDAVGIHHTAAQRLSGADFDGDTVLVIPNRNNKITITPALDSLKNFDPKRLYRNPEGVKFSGNKQNLMGNVSNLITDMTIKNAPHKDIALAVRHSMVVIDADTHDLNYKQSAIDHNIRSLKEKYQNPPGYGASTLISMAKSRGKDIPERKPRPYREGGPIDTKTGQLVYVPTGRMRNTPEGIKVPRTQRTRRLAEVTNAHDLSSGTLMEKIYADHSNRLKALANLSRLSMINTPSIKRSTSAAKVYSEEVKSLQSKLFLAQKNAPLERQANDIANLAVRARRASNPDMEYAVIKKIKAQELEKARNRIGAGKEIIDITPKEWDAIQAGAISNSQLIKIIANANIDQVRKYATPRPERVMTAAKLARAQAYLDLGYTRAEVASRLGVSVSTLDLATSADAEPESEHG